MRLLFLSLLYCIVPLTHAQESSIIEIRGKIMDSDSVPIAYSHVTLSKNRFIGVYSNSEGKFHFNIPGQYFSDSLLITHIGYENHYLKIYDNIDSLEIRLQAKPFMLNEIVVSSDTALEIVKKSIHRLKANLPQEKIILQGFFREIVRSDKTYDRLIEAAVDVFDKGYQSNGNKNLQFKIREIRQSDDFIDLDWLAAIYNYLSPINGLNGEQPESLFNSDYVRNNDYKFTALLNAPLNDDFFEFVDFSIDSVINYGNSEIVRIGIYPKDNKDSLLPEGYIDIRKNDYAIFQMEYILKINPSEKSNFRNMLYVPGQSYMQKTVIKYREYKGKMHLSFLYRKSFRMQMNFSKFRKTGGEEGVFYDEKLFITNEIISEKGQAKKFRKKDRQKSKAELYDEDWKYNENF